MSTFQTYRCLRHDRLIKLTEELANSGEAKVWRTDFKGYLAKIYHDPHNERTQKLQLMVRHIPADPNGHLKHISFAWPYSVLADNQGEVVVFLMPEVVGSETLLKLCTPQLRRKLKLETNWYFLHVVARNVAGIIQAIHREGYVLGDIKLENILVNNRALPTIIDTDSFQVPDPYNNRRYRCLVASEGFTPAELIGVDIASVDQTEVHDRFRLGVVVYYLLFGGPPFRGMWQGSGDAPEQSELIRRGLWPFSLDSLILPSQTTMPLEILHPRLQALFLRCFNDGHQFSHKRPTARDWSEALEASFNELVSCGKVDSHFYSLSYGQCYWCDRHQNLGLDIFPGQPVVKPPTISVPTPTNTGQNQVVKITGSTVTTKKQKLPLSLPPKFKKAIALMLVGATSLSLLGLASPHLPFVCETLENCKDETRKASAELSRKIKEYDQAIALNPKDPAIYIDRGKAKAELEDYEAAIKDYDQAIALNPKDPAIYIDRGEAKAELEDYEAAIKDYDQAIALNPKDPAIYIDRGKAKAELKDYEAAIKDYDQAIKIDDKYVVAYKERGNAKLNLKDYDEATKDYNKAIDIDPNFAPAYNNIGLIKARSKNYQDAIENYNQAIKLDPKLAVAYSNRGNVKINLKDYDGAIKDSNQAIKIDPKLASAYYARGTAKSYSKKYREAIKDYNQAIKINPKYALAYNNRGTVKVRLKDYTGAIEDYEQALKLDPKVPHAADNLARILKRLKRSNLILQLD